MNKRQAVKIDQGGGKILYGTFVKQTGNKIVVMVAGRKYSFRKELVTPA